MDKIARKIICALDVADLDDATRITRKLAPFVGAFKVGHALTLPYGLDVVDRIREAGANRIFLDLKFHDIPNSVALAVREASRRGVWMLTLHISGGPAMMQAAAEEAAIVSPDERPLLVGVSVLTSLDQHVLTNHLGVQRTIEEHMVYLSQLAMDNGLDGIVCSAQEIKALRKVVGHEGCIVTPGIRLSSQERQDQKRVGDASQALEDGADYLVMGRALLHSEDPERTLTEFGLTVLHS
jgi:orotidine-5'-phosphate decarboxylase